MEAHFGEWRFGQSGSEAPNPDTAIVCAQFGFGQSGSYRGSGVEIHERSFPSATPTLSRQPQRLSSGEILVWDGRLDNVPELVRELGISEGSPDSAVVSSAWLHWRQKALGRLLGDWALSVWNLQNHSLLLATDFLGSHHLYYAFAPHLVRWCTSLAPLVTLARGGLSLDDEYIAGWITGFPRADLTAFREIRRVPAACAVQITERGCAVRPYWRFDGSRITRHHLDADYEAHFLDLFGRSVSRCLRSALPVMAELSGGLDSSAIVCMADRISAAAGRPLIDTVSYYDKTEPNWDEQLWFSKVEAARGKAGLHIDVSLPECSEKNRDDQDAFPCWPGASPNPQKNPLLEYMVRGGHRVLLSGIGGDEFLGGVPTPIPELEDLLARGHVLRLLARLTAWSLVQRRPLIHLLRDATAGFLPVSVARRVRHRHSLPWLNPQFARRQRWALEGYPLRWRLLGPLPTFQENLDALDTIRRQLSCTEVTACHPFEKRYPFLDRDLLEFLFSIPREQLVRPGQRRSLMRRALGGLVPDEILGRRRKAYITRAPLRIAEAEYEKWSCSDRRMMVERHGYAESAVFLEVLQAVRQGRSIPVIPILRAIALEEWLDFLESKGWLKRSSLGTGHLSELAFQDKRRNEDGPGRGGLCEERQVN